MKISTFLTCLLVLLASLLTIQTTYAQNFLLEENTDRPGADYRDFEYTEDSINPCLLECQRESRCKACTYVPRTYQGAEAAHCWLKDSIPSPVTRQGLYTWVKESGSQRGVMIRHDGDTYLNGYELPGNDYSERQIRYSDNQTSCRTICMADERCKAFTYFEDTIHRTKTCYLKEAYTIQRSRPHTISWIKPQANARATVVEFWEGIDLPGSDYDSVPLDEVNPRLCKQACDRDSRCKSYTMLKPNLPGGRALCYLKDAVPAQRQDQNCVSGRKLSTYETASEGYQEYNIPDNTVVGRPVDSNNTSDNTVVGRPVDSNNNQNRLGVGHLQMRVDSATGLEYNANRPGCDYSDVVLSTNDPLECKGICDREERCRSFTFVPAGIQDTQPKCWLKHSAPDPIFDYDTVSGVKR